jgi:protocatechuate 3,4-dioxygenase beta subunit
MIIDHEQRVTEAVHAAIAGTKDARLKEIVGLFVKHAHAFLRAARPTDEEFDAGLRFLAALGHHTHETNNEVVLAADVLGLSTLVKLLNHPLDTAETAAALLGPFYRANAPWCEPGDSIARSPTPGPTLFVEGQVRDEGGAPLAGAVVDVWQSSPVGLYENQDPHQENMNLRGRFRTDAEGRYRFRSVKPAGYPVPTNGPVGRLLEAQGRHPYRPAHLHFLVSAEGHETLITQIFADDDEHLRSDVVFGVTAPLVGSFERHDRAAPPVPPEIEPPYYTLRCDLVLRPGVPSFPVPPIP